MQGPFGCSRCRWSKGGCLSCNPAKTERWLARQAAAAAAAEEAAAAAAAAAKAPAPEEPAWEALAESEAVVPTAGSEEDAAGMEVDEEGGAEGDAEDWEMSPDDMELLAAAFEDMHS